MATLTRVAGLEHLELAEDAVQTAFATALEEWTRGQIEAEQAHIFEMDKMLRTP